MRRYTEEELALILNRAAERQEGMEPSVPRYSLDDIQEIAAGAGISADHVASVAASLADGRVARAGLLGAPTGFRFEESIDGEITDEVIAELFELARRETGLQGTVSEALGLHEWKGEASGGETFVSVARRGGRTTIVVLAPRSDAAGLVGMLGGFGALGGSMALSMLLGNATALPDAMVVPMALVGASGSAWFGMRAVWRRLARRVASRTDTLGAALVGLARRAVDDRRVGG